MKKLFASVALSAIAASQAVAGGVEKNAVLTNYADIAHAVYEDSLTTAEALKVAVAALVQNPSDETLKAARNAWIAARAPYQQSEVYRFGNAIVDDWEGKVNAWPLDEGLIDYVDASYGDESDENSFYVANVIANEKLTLGGQEIDASTITKDLLAESLHEVDEVEANVATGYHAIEFLLWGQDLNGTGPGAGNRPATDFDVKNCTGGHCDRRVQYLTAATDLLIDDLKDIVAAWDKGGEARKLVLADADQGINSIVTGMGSLSYGELAGERMKLGLMLNDPEEEHDCFSDNTHNSHYYDAKGIQNIYLGSYTRVDGSKVEGASLSQLVAEKDAAADKEMTAKLAATMEKMTVLVKTAEGGKAYDQMLAEGDADGNKVIQDAVDALTAQTKSLEKAVAALGISKMEFEGSDSLDNPEAVYN
ncbi:imelysin family protein [Aestuariispira insulae]|uniref:Putative iron-regulated protein n=1 Tax=Aestuariispira insulae TaxID=1461337 RepID=A0A3D9HJD0_9PROT|nr:imelysin family protein [Aestuariispira insulae]RED49632.1 putative iron-regulated protein [Aestuariispira insulae]